MNNKRYKGIVANDLLKTRTERGTKEKVEDRCVKRRFTSPAGNTNRITEQGNAANNVLKTWTERETMEKVEAGVQKVRFISLEGNEDGNAIMHWVER